jgi:hypothetical protein
MDWKIGLAVLAAGAIAVAAAAPASAANRCLQFKQIKLTHMSSPKTMEVTTVRNDRYLVRFTDVCRVGDQYSWNHFTYTDLLVGDCLNARDVLPTSKLGPCVVESVTQVEKPAG